jgi:uncharacterized membrane protein YphA (DoxX/SURF4 family)
VRHDTPEEIMTTALPTVPPAPTRSPRRRRLLTALCWILAVEFAVGGVAKFVVPSYDGRFVDWGYPGWFRFVVGAGEIAAAVLLVLPRRRFLGAALLVVVLTGATLTHILNQDPLTEGLSAPIHLVLVSIVAWATRPLPVPSAR